MDHTNAASLLAVAAMSVALLSSFVILMLVAKFGPRALGSPRGWALIAAGLVLVSGRTLIQLVQGPSLEGLRRSAGILAAILLPIGVYLVFRQTRIEGELDERVDPHLARQEASGP